MKRMKAVKLSLKKLTHSQVVVFSNILFRKKILEVQLKEKK